MTDKRKKNANWNVVTDEGVCFERYDYSTLAVLMDIRDELQALNAVLHCHNFLRIPSVLDQVVRNTKKPARKRKVAIK